MREHGSIVCQLEVERVKSKEITRIVNELEGLPDPRGENGSEKGW